MKKSIALILVIVLSFLLLCTGCHRNAVQEVTTTVRILATSDMHGYFVPYDYFANRETDIGSCANAVSAIAALRNDNTIVVDAGDLIQDNCADLFLEDEVHPMAAVLNAGGYDAWVTGNHEYNFGMEALNRFIAAVDAPLIVGNVSHDGEGLGEDYLILERDGIRIALIGAVSPNIKAWDTENLKEWDVENPVSSVRRAIDEIGDRADLFVGVFHMGLENELNVPGSGVNDIAEACPELDFIVSAHDHRAFAEETSNGIPVVGNNNFGQTVARADITVTRHEDGSCSVDGVDCEIIKTSDYPVSEAVVNATLEQDARAKEMAARIIGSVTGGVLIPEGSANGLCTVDLGDSAWMQFIADVMRFYTDADVCATFATLGEQYVPEGDLTNADIANIYHYNNNTLYKLQLTGKQLKTYMEWSVAFYNRFSEGDVTVSFNPDMRYYNYDMFDGIRYEINISKPAGERIENLCWYDGREVAEEDVLTLAVSNYRASAFLLTPGVIFEENDLPVLLESYVGGNNLQQLMSSYIKEELGGIIIPYSDDNWHLTGIERDEALYTKALELIADGRIEIHNSEDGRTSNIVSITEADVKAFSD